MEDHLARLAKRHAPQLLPVVGIGPDTAVTLLITIGDNPERLAVRRPSPRCVGSAPSSVLRAVGSAVASTVAATGRPTPCSTASCFTRLPVGPRTQDYYERRIKGGKTRREIVRCLKRYAAREVFHLVRPTQA
jgi:transposase